MKRTIGFTLMNLIIASSIAFAGTYTVVTTPDQDVAIQQAMKAKRGAFLGQDEKHLVQLMLDRGVKGYRMYVTPVGRGASHAPTPKPTAH